MVDDSSKKVTWLICFLILALGVVLVIAPKRTDVELVGNPLPFEVTESTAYDLNFAFKDVYPTIRLELLSTVPIVVQYEGKRLFSPNSARRENRNRLWSKKVLAGYKHTMVMTPGHGSVDVSVFAAEGAGMLTGVSCEVVKETHVTNLSTLSPSAKMIFGGGFVILLLATGFIGGASSPYVRWAWSGFSLFVLAWLEPGFAICLLVFLTLMYRLKETVGSKGFTVHRLMLLLGCSIAFLVFFKYSKSAFLQMMEEPSGFSLLMPLGVSYFVIRLIDTQLRWYRRQNLDVGYGEFLYYMLFPGTLIAGPIESVHDFYGRRIDSLTRQDVADGLARILIGLFKKIVIADALLFPAIHGLRLGRLLWHDSGGSVERVLANPAMAQGSEILAFAVAGFLFAYVDFSAYSDMAIGVSRLMGHKIRENFNFPIFAPNVREFWQRWHMSLSDWAFRNAYFPLLLKTRNSFVPLYVTMMLIGMWHAPNLSWFSWAVHHATGLMVVAFMQRRFPLPRKWAVATYPFRMMATFTFVALGFIFVYFTDYATALQLYSRAWLWVLTLGQI